MTWVRVGVIISLLSMAMGAGLAATLRIPVVADATASATLLAKARAAGRCFAADVVLDRDGSLIGGTTEGPLAPGRYRLHVLLARAPLGYPMSNGVEVTLKAGEATRGVQPLHFARPYEFIDQPLTFTHGGGAMAWSVRWALPGKLRAAHKLKPVNPDDPDAEEDEEAGGERPQPAEDGTIAVQKLGTMPSCVAAMGLHLERLAPVTVRVVADKVVYTPGETGTATVTLTNVGARPVTAAVALAVLTGVESRRAAGGSAVPVPAGQTITWTGTFPTTGLRWGAEVCATATLDDGSTESARTICAVSANPFEVAMLAAQGPNLGLGWKDPKNAAQQVATWREAGFTGCECFFWAPCDFGEFTPEHEDFFSGQTQYAHSISGTKNLIAALHTQGMAATVYSNLWGTDGWDGFELLRKHPEWFQGNLQYASDYLEFWRLMLAKKVQTPHQWCETWLKQDPAVTDGAIEWHANELIASHRMFGWDGVRYDSYYSNGWTRWATQRTRRLVEAAVPGYQFGYNSFPTSDAAAGALEAMYSGGGMSMLEYIRQESYPSLGAYANELLQCRDIVWPYGGQIGPLYHTPAPPDTQPTSAGDVDALYLSALTLACGAHPYYHPLESSIGQHQHFGLRFSEYLWDNRLRPLKEPAAVVAFGQAVTPLAWQRLALTRTLNAGDQRLVVHLLNADPKYQLFTNTAQTLPAPWRQLPVTVTLPPGAQLKGAWSLCPIPEVRAERLDGEVTNGKLTLIVPEVRVWSVLVIDFAAPQPLATVPDLRALGETCIQDWYIAGLFPNPGEKSDGFDAVYLPEKGVELQATYPGVNDTTVRWQRTVKPGDPALGAGPVDFALRFATDDRVCAYAYTRVTSDQAREALLLTGSDDTLQVWLNGDPVVAKKVFRGIGMDSDQTPIRLKAGANHLLVKVCNVGGGWGFILRLGQRDGTPLVEGVRYGWGN
jgi:hypothetical protein